jgi:hypothetical protein
VSVNILWTGGWDSSFRLLQAAICERTTVQPHYVIDHGRRSVHCEVKAMASIKDRIAERFPDARQRILPTVFYERCEIPANAEISASHAALIAQSHLGTQYEWISRLAASGRISRLELSVHRDDRAHAFLLDVVSRDAHGDYSLAPSAAGPAATLFKGLVFPLFDMTKLEMAAAARAHAFADILELTWFCADPDRNMQPCGACGPCLYTIGEGLARRVPRANRVKAQVGRVYRGVGRRLRRIVAPGSILRTT